MKEKIFNISWVRHRRRKSLGADGRKTLVRAFSVYGSERLLVAGRVTRRTWWVWRTDRKPSTLLEWVSRGIPGRTTDPGGCRLIGKSTRIHF